MGLTTKKTSVGATTEGWGMGFFLVFFPQDHHQPPTILRRTNSSHILARAQSTISICALLIFCTLLLFTLSTFDFEPNNAPTSHSRPTPALQGLGTLYSRGTRPMNDLLLCHVADSLTLTQLKTFLRAFHRSGLLAISDLLFIFPSITTPASSDNVIRQENDMFLKLVRDYQAELSNGGNVSASFDVTQFMKSGNKEGEPIWGRKTKTNFNSSESTHGSVVGFGVGELDPENSLSGFLDHVPMSLRRWASYPMILGRLRRNFKHVMLVDVKEVLLLGDPLTRLRNRSPESVFLSSAPPTRHNRKPHQKTMNPAVIMGGARGVRRLSAAMLTEIVRATTHNKRKSPVSEAEVLSRLATKEFVQKSIHMVAIPEAEANGTVVGRGNSDVDIDVMNHICSFSIESGIYTECGKVQPF